MSAALSSLLRTAPPIDRPGQLPLISDSTMRSCLLGRATVMLSCAAYN